MAFITDIWKRSILNGITGFLLYGTETESQDTTDDYQAQLEKAYQHCKSILLRYDTDQDSDLFRSVQELVAEHERVYMEIGLLSGLLLFQDALKQQENG